MIALLSFPIYFLLMRLYHKDVRDSQREVMSAYAKNESNYIDTLQGIATVKSMNKEPLFEQVTKLIYGFFQQKIYALGLVRIRLSFWAELGSVLLIITVIAYSAFLVLQKSLQTGEMMAVLGIVGSLIPSVSRLAMLNIELQEAKVAFDRMFEFIGLKPEYQTVFCGGGKNLIVSELHIPSKPSPQERAFNKLENLEVRNLNFRFTGRNLILENVSFEVKKGEILALTGESGSGKSTILQILQKFYEFESGEILINGQFAWNEIDTRNWRELIGTVPQEITIFSGTVLDNICMGDTQKEAENIIRFCQEYGFSKYFEAFPQSYLTLVGEAHIHLSGGQKQLLALARALYRKPQLLLLDEATSAMDSKMESFVLELLTQLKPEMMILMVTYKYQLVKQAVKTVAIKKTS